MQIKGLEKTSLLDYPEHIAVTIFTGGCNMRCPFCHNRDLVLNSPSDLISTDQLFDYLITRKLTHEAVCITGGEPTLQEDLLDFMKEINQIGYKVKLDTNGLKPKILERALEQNLLDYVAMDIKNTKIKYANTAGITTQQLYNIEESVHLLMEDTVPYEFRTTTMKELHCLEDFILIGNWLKGSKKYILQQYKSSPFQLSPQIFTSYSLQELEEIKTEIVPFFGIIDIRA
ncbi:MAG: anaerobic ribonucleoside-triphosphate reductase activating protein [Firmicutes bacterium HGW-Firmicutes-7]|nr:MAG: anaerobic ribonucleoside-triphosphate reductase activating protein [Firmicutes bacterium HGW-Firmicutes-7]